MPKNKMMKIVKEDIKRIAFITLCSDDPLKIAGVDKRKWYNPDIEVSPEDYYELNLDQIDNVELILMPLTFMYGTKTQDPKEMVKVGATFKRIPPNVPTRY